MSKEIRPTFTIEQMTLDTYAEANEMRLQSWLDTYVNDTVGVTREWIERRTAMMRSPEQMQKRRERLLGAQSLAWIAMDASGAVIGCVEPYSDKRGVQHVGSLYTSKEWHGRGVGSALMQKVIDWADPKKPIELGVATYNERAKAFYRKWGFVEVPDSESLYDDKIPEIKMVRKGDLQ